MSAVADLIDAARLKLAGTHQPETILLHAYSTPQHNGATLPHDSHDVASVGVLGRFVT